MTADRALKQAAGVALMTSCQLRPASSSQSAQRAVQTIKKNATGVALQARTR